MPEVREFITGVGHAPYVAPMDRWPEWIQEAMPTKGSWPEWIAAVFTSLAFVVAAVSYARDVRVRREAQARLVYSR